MTSLLHQNEWRIIDQSSLGPQFNAMHSFAIDDTLCTFVGNHSSPPTIRSWVHHKTIVLGIQDTRLPNIKEGIHYLKQLGYPIIVRNSGGLAVVLDKGVLNLSLIFPEGIGIDINRGYDAMWELIKDMYKLHSVNIEAKEIVGSYCPGSYDLSIHNKKFAGISQRRIRGGIAVQIYLCISESGSERAEVIKTFYEKALGQSETKFEYPTIQPETMASLSELLKQRFTIQDTMYLVLTTLKAFGSKLTPSQLQNYELESFEENLERMVKRNEKALGAFL